MEKFECVGMFWLPDDANDPTKYMYGELSFDPIKGGTLSIHEHPLNNKADSMEKWDVHVVHGKDKERINIIHGQNMRGDALTLQGGNNCEQVSRDILREYNYTRPRCKLDVERIFVGHHFDKEEDIIFKNLSIKYTYLGAYLNHYMIKWVDPYVREVLDYNPQSKIYENPKSITIFEDDTMRIKAVMLKHTFEHRNYRTSDYDEYDAWIDISLIDDKMSFMDCVELIDIRISNFLTLLSGTLNHPHKITGTLKDERDVSVYHPLLRYEEPKEGAWLNSLVDFESILPDVQGIFTKWINKYEVLWGVHEEYFNYKVIKTHHKRSKYLAFLRALEALSRVQGYSGEEYNLRRRMNFLLDDSLKPVKDKYIIRDNDFIHRLISTRNYLEHKLTEKDVNVLIKDEELYRYNRLLKLMVEVGYLNTMDVSVDVIKKIVNSGLHFIRAEWF